MAEGRPVYLRRPASPEIGLREDFYLQVDPNKGGWFTEFYIRESKNRTGFKDYIRIQGLEHNFRLGTDPAQLIEQWKESVELIEATLSSRTETETFAAEVRQVVARVPELVKAIADGQTVYAGEILQQFGLDLLQVTTTATNQVLKLSKSAEHDKNIAAALLEALEQEDVEGIVQYVATALSEDIRRGLAAIAEIRAYEVQLDTARELMLEHQARWSKLSEGPESWLSKQLSKIGSDEDGFCAQAARLMLSGAPEEGAIESLLANAEDVLAMIRRQQADSISEHEAGRQMAFNVLTQIKTAEAALRTLARSREQVGRFKRRGMSSFTLSRGLLEPDELQEWERTTSDPNWNSHMAVDSRLRDKTRSINSLLGENPTLPASAEGILRRAEDYVERLKRTRSTPEVRRVDPQPIASPIAAPPVPPTEVEPAPSSIDNQRGAEIYDMAKAVAAFVYCSHHNFVGGRPRRLLELLARLEKISEEEAILYRDDLMTRIEQESYILGERENRAAVWRRLPPNRAIWMQFRSEGSGPGSVTVWRLCEKAQPLGLSLAAKYGIDRETVLELHKARVAETREKRRLRHA